MIAFLLQKHTDHFDQGVWQDDDNNTYKSRTVHRSVVVAQLEEQLLPTPEVQGLNLVIGILLSRRFVYCQLKRKEESKEKEAGNGPFLLKKTRQWTSRKN